MSEPFRLMGRLTAGTGRADELEHGFAILAAGIACLHDDDLSETGRQPIAYVEVFEAALPMVPNLCASCRDTEYPPSPDLSRTRATGKVEGMTARHDRSSGTVPASAPNLLVRESTKTHRSRQQNCRDLYRRACAIRAFADQTWFFPPHRLAAIRTTCLPRGLHSCFRGPKRLCGEHGHDR